MSFSRDEPNPLRPYAVPSSFQPTTGSGPSPPLGSQSHVKHSSRTAPSARPSYGAAGRDILSDLDYGDYLADASPSVTEMVKRLVDQGLWKYTSVLLAQPFEVAKVVLQVQDAEALEKASGGKKDKKPRRQASYGREGSYALSSDDSDNDSQSYFTSTAPLGPSSAQKPSRRRRQTSSPSPPASPSPRPSDGPAATHVHNLASASSIGVALSTLWTHEGAWGVWKGTNSTFVHSILSSTITSFLRSLLVAVLGLPDAGASATSIPSPANLAGIDISNSPSPALALLAAVIASGLAGLVLAPVDIARTRLILTPSSHPPRSLLPTLRSLGSWVIPTSLIPATLLHACIPTAVATATPLVLRANLGIDPVLTPTTYAAATFVSQTVELGLRLPVETVLRRGQVAALRSAGPGRVGARRLSEGTAGRKLLTIVEIGEYRGLVGTMSHIVFTEGTREEVRPPVTTAAGRAAALQPARKKKGQGLSGLFRGWRVGIWGLVGVWGAATLGGGKGDEF